MKTAKIAGVHLAALEVRLIKLQMLRRNYVHSHTKYVRTLKWETHSPEFTEVRNHLQWLFAQGVIGSAGLGKMLSIFHESLQDCWRRSNATLDVDDHPLIARMRWTWKLSRFKTRLGFDGLVLDEQSALERP